MRLVLASTSAARRALLTAAGVPHAVAAPEVDEAAIKAALRAQGKGPAEIAIVLAEAKAVEVSRTQPGALVLGADQLLALPGDETLDKPADLAEARAQLCVLRGGEHRLIAAAALAEDGAIAWRCVDTASLTMRDFSDAFLDEYLAREGAPLLTTVGGYRLEGLGVQLFARISGDHFTILGLPLLAVLGELRARGALAI